MEPSNPEQPIQHPSVHDVVFGGKKELPENDQISMHLSEVLAHRPPESARSIIHAIDTLMHKLEEPADPKKVAEVLKRVKEHGWHSWEQQDGLGDSLERVTVAELAEGLKNRYVRNAPYSTAAPERNKDIQQHHTFIENCYIAKAAAAQARAAITEEYSAEDAQDIITWQEATDNWFTLLKNVEGMERTKLAFDGVEHLGEFAKSIKTMTKFLEETPLSSLDERTRANALKVDAFLKHHFFWKDNSYVLRSVYYQPSLPRSVAEKGSLINATTEWQQAKIHDKVIGALTPAFDASAALHRLRSTLPTLPIEQQSQFRRKASREIRYAFRGQLLSAAQQIQDAFENISLAKDVSWADLHQLRESLIPFENSVTLTQEERQAFNESIELWFKRAKNIKRFNAKMSREAVDHNKEYTDYVVKQLFNYDIPGKKCEIVTTTLGIEIYPATKEDYDRMAKDAPNSGGAFFTFQIDGGDLPVILIKPSGSKGDITNIVKHERAHAMVGTMYEQSNRFQFPPPKEILPSEADQKNRLEDIVNRFVIPYVKNEIIAYRVGNTSFDDIEKILTEDPLYDYLGKNRVNWGLNNGPLLQAAKEKYHHALRAAIAVAKKAAAASDISAELKPEDMNVLLAMLPMQQWKHLLTVPKSTQYSW